MQTIQSETVVSPLQSASDISEEVLHQLAAQQKSRKKWLLVQPISNTSMMVDSGSVSMPLNLIMVASLVGKLFDVTFIDERLGNKIPEDLSGFDVVAITSRTLNATKAYKIGDAALRQGKIVILGGVHPTMLHDEAASHCTSVVYGEIESIWTELATDVLTGKMKPIYRAKELKPMSSMIHPDFSYALSSPSAKKYSSLIPILATKGCPVGCNFCTTPTIYGKNYRYRELDLVLDEMRYHQKRLNKEKINFSFMDDNISFRPQYFMTLLEEMAKLGVHWNANISMNFLDKPEVAELAGRSGCDLLSIGFESLNPETLKSVHKGSNRLGNYETVVSNLHKNGIAIQGYFMFGFDNDTEESFQLTYDFIMKNRIEFPVFSLVTPFPGTPYFDEMKPRIRHFDWDKYDTYHYMFEPSKMSGEKLLSNFVKLQKEVYKGRSIMQRMKGKPLNWVWFVNYMMHRFTKKLSTEYYY
ncbi:B12-binding domain-containing radical SAM protein [Chlorobium sp. BLA1]|uniref:B12-binding domain-containing radical SAM protein n=1 Tax=Candidatus Chlorobium masyuteum TaxID=2716876 RepID=UPI00141DA63E|nr:radical SAM protein [Candidatus Chlorobium masyuteum]NHQ61240.1 B12-binding domain-containing radical SAM protein [Candidatus Chlorobium masyuteum]NTU45830.1 B12-binding domain-containing radical SAM protein [Chlorobiaceae bacterium]